MDEKRKISTYATLIIGILALRTSKGEFNPNSVESRKFIDKLKGLKDVNSVNYEYSVLDFINECPNNC